MKITENYIIYVILHYHSVNTHSVVPTYIIVLDTRLVRGVLWVETHPKMSHKPPCVRQGIWSSIAQSVEHVAVNRVVAGKAQLGEPKDVTINSWCWWRRGSTPRPRGLCSLRADFAIRSRIAPSLVLSPKSGAFRRPLLPNTEVKPCSAENTWLATAREDRKMPTSDSGFFSLKSEKYSSIVHPAARFHPDGC